MHYSPLKVKKALALDMLVYVDAPLKMYIIMHVEQFKIIPT